MDKERLYSQILDIEKSMPSYLHNIHCATICLSDFSYSHSIGVGIICRDYSPMLYNTLFSFDQTEGGMEEKEALSISLTHLHIFINFL